MDFNQLPNEFFNERLECQRRCNCGYDFDRRRGCGCCYRRSCCCCCFPCCFLRLFCCGFCRCPRGCYPPYRPDCHYDYGCDCCRERRF